MKFINRFRTLEEAKKYALDNTKNYRIMVIIGDKDVYYDVCSAEIDMDVSMIVDNLLEYMNDNNCYVAGFTYKHRGWNSNCTLYIDINY